MGRVSLTEDYDDRSVIAKLNEMDKRVTENTTVVTAAEASAQASAAAAQETADRFAGSVGAVVQNANAQINASKAQVDQAKAEVDETVTTVAQAVNTANQASASAQQSATTVEGYDARLTAAESKNAQQDTDITALQTADAQNVKIKRINEYAVGLTGNQENIVGNKGFLNEIRRVVTGNYVRGMLTKLDKWKIGEAVGEQVTYWPVVVSDTGVNNYPFLITMSETTDGRDILGFECKGQNNLTFGLRIVCTANEVVLYLVSGNTIQDVARITR